MNDIQGPRNSFRRPFARVGGVSASADVAPAPAASSQQQEESKKPSTGGSSRRTKLVTIGGAALIVVLAATSGFFFWQYKSSKGDDNNAAVSQNIISSVSSLYLVPEGEEPTVAEIKDKDKLKDQAFFDKAQNGDYLLVYNKAKIAIIYRSPANKLVNVSPVQAGVAADNNIRQDVMGDSSENATQNEPKPDKPDTAPR